MVAEKEKDMTAMVKMLKQLKPESLVIVKSNVEVLHARDKIGEREKKKGE